MNNPPQKGVNINPIPADNPPQTILEFQSYDHHDTANLALPAPATQATTQAAAASAPFYSLNRYKPYFNVDTDDVVHRMRLSIFPTAFFFDEIRENPDAYGPFWISTSLVFFLFVCGSIAQSIVAWWNKQSYTYDLTNLSIAASTTYSYAFLLPLIWWALFKWWKISVPYLHLVSLYGYGMSILIPAAVICVVPLEFLRWIIIAVACVASGFFIVRNMIPELRKSDAHRGSATVITFVILVLHAALLIAYKMVFFQVISVNTGNNAPAPTTTP